MNGIELKYGEVPPFCVQVMVEGGGVIRWKGCGKPAQWHLLAVPWQQHTTDNIHLLVVSEAMPKNGKRRFRTPLPDVLCEVFCGFSLEHSRHTYVALVSYQVGSGCIFNPCLPVLPTCCPLICPHLFTAHSHSCFAVSKTVLKVNYCKSGTFHEG